MEQGIEMDLKRKLAFLYSISYLGVNRFNILGKHQRN